VQYHARDIARACSVDPQYRTSTCDIAWAQQAMKLTMMATTTTMAAGDDEDDGDGATGDGAMGCGDGDDGGRRR